MNGDGGSSGLAAALVTGFFGVIVALIYVVGQPFFQIWLERQATATPVAPSSTPSITTNSATPGIVVPDTSSPDNVIQASDTPVPKTDTATPTVRPPTKVLFDSDKTMHLGDEDVLEWELLFGDCLDIDFTNDILIQTLTLELQTFGAEAQNSISLNGRQIAILPRQVSDGSEPSDRPNKWTSDVTIPIPVSGINEGVNTVSICAELNPAPDFSGDTDDFQIRAIRLIAN